MAEINIPEHWTKSDVEGFLKYIKPDPEDRTGMSDLRSEHSCLDCGFYEHHDCTIASSSCATAVFNHRNPPRWISKE